MFDCLFGWRKASKCKKLIRRVQCRLKLLKTKRQAIVRQLRDDVAQLIQIGYQDLAFKRAEHLVNDETVLELYELLENFCEFVVSHLSYIRRNKEIPNDINEAVSSLIFASARCGDLPELRAIRKLFRERYGQKFEATALELLPGNLVNLQVKDKLSIESVPDDMKTKLLDEIAKETSLQQPGILAIEFASEFHRQNAGSYKPENPNPESYQDDTISTTVSSSVTEQCSLDVMDLESLEISFAAVYTKENQMTSSSESLPRISDEIIVHLDDIEEVTHCNEKDGIVPDQRIFKFKSPVKLQKDTKGTEKDNFDPTYDSWSYSDSQRKKAANSGARRTKKRSMSRENFGFKDTQCAIYYDKPKKNAEKRHIAPKGSYSKTSSPLTKKEEKPVYLRAKTMPQERFKESHSDKIQRSISLPVVSPIHVHPKLPNYDEIAAKFMALKEEHKQNKRK